MNRANEGSVNNDNSAVSSIAMTVDRENGLEVVAGGEISKNTVVTNGMEIPLNEGELETDNGIIYKKGEPVIKVPVSAKEVKDLTQRRKEQGRDGERDDDDGDYTHYN